MRLLCQQGAGLARLPLYLVESDLASGALVEAFPGSSFGTHELYLVSPKISQLTKKQKIARQVFLDWYEENRARYFL